jgi:hypothetical protein
VTSYKNTSIKNLKEMRTEDFLGRTNSLS